MNKRYTKEQIEYVRKIGHQTDRTNAEITEMFNERFNENVTINAINGLKYRNGIKSRTDYYTKKQIKYLREISSGRTNKEITEMFNKKFNQNRTESGIHCIRQKYKIFTGDNGRFKKGEKPPNWVPIDSERVTKDGYIQIKIREGQQQRNWRGKHILIWERENGPLPKGYAIIFGDGDNRNFDLDNLICVSRKQLLGLNRHGLIKDDAELTKTAINVVNLKYKIADVEKGVK